VHELEPKLVITIMHGQQHIKKVNLKLLFVPVNQRRRKETEKEA